MSNPLQTLQQLADDAARRKTDELRDQYVRIFASVYDRAHAYTLGVIAVTYASAFGVWAFVRDLMAPRQHAAAGLLLIVSVRAFVIWEIWATLNASLDLIRFARTLAHVPPEGFEAAMNKHEAARREAEVANTRGWLVSFWLSVGGGMMALGVMVYAIVGALWKTLWPA